MGQEAVHRKVKNPHNTAMENLFLNLMHDVAVLSVENVGHCYMSQLDQ